MERFVPFGMPHNTFVWLAIYGKLSFRQERLKRSEFPKGTRLVTRWNGKREYRYYAPEKLVTVTLEHGKQGHAYKVAPRGGLVKQYDNIYSQRVHIAEIKRHARRTARRKVRQMLHNLSDPEGEYNSRYLPGVTYEQWK